MGTERDYPRRSRRHRHGNRLVALSAAIAWLAAGVCAAAPVRYDPERASASHAGDQQALSAVRSPPYASSELDEQSSLGYAGHDWLAAMPERAGNPGDTLSGGLLDLNGGLPPAQSGGGGLLGAGFELEGGVGAPGPLTGRAPITEPSVAGDGAGVAIPLPPGGWTGLICLTGLAAAMGLRKLSHRPR